MLLDSDSSGSIERVAAMTNVNILGIKNSNSFLGMYLYFL
jgi:hypothetical protein